MKEKMIGLPRLYIVIPCYNEENVLPLTSRLFLEKIQSLIQREKIHTESRILYVNDGSKDNTWNFICDLAKENKCVSGISLSRNQGHQNALMAGLMEAKDKADITISIDCDGQDDIDAMDQMIDAYADGAEIVYGVRKDRSSDTFFKRFSAECFYKMLRWLGAEVVYNHADYRLVSSKVLNAFTDFKEVNVYLRGMFPLVGFKSTSVFYERKERIAGTSKYTLRKMIALAWEGVSSLSIRPIRMITVLGLGVSALSLLMIIWVFISFFTGNTVPGWSSSVLCTCLLGGIQLTSLGVIGEYVGKIYLETKARPRYIIAEKTDDKIQN